MIFSKNVLLILLLFYSCSTAPTADETWNAARQKITENNSLQFKWKQYQDTRLYNKSQWIKGEIRYSKLAKSQYGFGFHTFFNDFVEDIYDGKTYKKIAHDLKVVWNLDTSNEENLNKSISTFVDFKAILNDYEFDYVSDTTISNQKMFVYQQIKDSETPEKKRFRFEHIFIIDAQTQLLHQLKTIAIQEDDTAQILTAYFTDYKISTEEYDFTAIDTSRFANYPSTISQEIIAKNTKDQVKKGDKIGKSKYLDINGNELALYGNNNKKTVIMFSYKDCGGCKLAMKAMKKKGFKIKDDINFYYSNPVDEASILASYLKKEQFSFPVFTKSSNMSKDFGIWSYPTFVVLDTKGKVEKVVMGYKEKEVNKILF